MMIGANDQYDFISCSLKFETYFIQNEGITISLISLGFLTTLFALFASSIEVHSLLCLDNYLVRVFKKIKGHRTKYRCIKRYK